VRYDEKHIAVFSQNNNYSCPTSMKHEFSHHIFPNKLTKGIFLGTESFHLDRHDAGNSRFSQFYKCI